MLPRRVTTVQTQRNDGPGIMDELGETLIWYDALDPTFKFLFALPFIVAAAGVVSDWLRTRRGNRS